MEKKICISLGLFLIITMLSCSTKGKFQKLNNDEILYLIKVDSFGSKISKIYNPNEEQISFEEQSNYPFTDFFADYYFNNSRDSLIVKLRKKRIEDDEFIQQMGFYSEYRNHVDTIYSKIMIDCSMVDLLLDKAIEADQANRTGFTEYDKMIEVENQRLLLNIFEQCGFPHSKNIKKESVVHAFIILLHSDYKIQKKYYDEVVKAIEAGDLRKSDIAYLEDKMLRALQRPQKYGTQDSYNENGNLILAPYDDFEKVNERRIEVGLPVLDENKR